MRCNDDSIHETMDQLTIECLRVIAYTHDTEAHYNNMEDYVKRLPCVMLKSILYNTHEFNPLNGDNVAYGYFNGNGKKITLVGKVIYLYMSSTRRKFPMLFLKHTRSVRRELFRRQIYWHKISEGMNDDIAESNAIRFANSSEHCYNEWTNAINLDMNAIIENVVQSSILERDPYNNSYDLIERGLHESRLELHNQYSSFTLAEIKYSLSEGLHIKKSFINSRLTNNNLFIFAYTRNYLHLRLVDDVLILSQRNLRLSGNNIRKLNIEICLDKQMSECENFDCAICLETKRDDDGRIVLACKHEFCGSCMNQSLNDYRSKTTQPICALCRGEIKMLTIKKSDSVDEELIANMTNMCVF
jgi:hypothetical protein